jgi:hypothetical protein
LRTPRDQGTNTASGDRLGFVVSRRACAEAAAQLAEIHETCERHVIKGRTRQAVTAWASLFPGEPVPKPLRSLQKFTRIGNAT